MGPASRLAALPAPGFFGVREPESPIGGLNGPRIPVLAGRPGRPARTCLGFPPAC